MGVCVCVCVGGEIMPCRLV